MGPLDEILKIAPKAHTKKLLPSWTEMTSPLEAIRNGNVLTVTIPGRQEVKVPLIHENCGLRKLPEGKSNLLFAGREGLAMFNEETFGIDGQRICGTGYCRITRSQCQTLTGATQTAKPYCVT